METRAQAAKKRRERQRESEGGFRPPDVSWKAAPEYTNRAPEMDSLVETSPESKRLRKSSVDANGFTVLPDAAIHRIFDFLERSCSDASKRSRFILDTMKDQTFDMPPMMRRFPRSHHSRLGAHTFERAALSQSCRRFNRYYRDHYVSKLSSPIRFGNVTYILIHFPRLVTLERCALLEGRPVGYSNELYHRIRNINLKAQVEGQVPGILSDLAAPFSKV